MMNEEMMNDVNDEMMNDVNDENDVNDVNEWWNDRSNYSLSKETTVKITNFQQVI